MPYVMPQDLRTGVSGYFVRRDFPVPYSSLPPAGADPMLAGQFVAAPGVIGSGQDKFVNGNLSGDFAETSWAVPPFRSTPQAPLGQDFTTDVAAFVDRYKWWILGGGVLLLTLGGSKRRRKLF